MGSVGESYALETARRMELPEEVLERATLLLDDETRRLLALQQRLEEEIERARAKQTELDEEIEQLDEREKQIEEEKVLLQLEIDKMREGRTDEFLVELRMKERELETMMRRVHEIMAVAANATKAEREKVIEEVKVSVKSVRQEVEKVVVEQVAQDLATPLVAGEPIEEGTVVMILEKGNLFGSRGVVTQRNKGRGRVVLRVAGVEVKMERHLLGIPHRSGHLEFLTNASNEKELSAKDKRLLKMLNEELVDPDKLSGPKLSRKKEGKVGGVRSSKNTVDVRALGVSDAQTLSTTFMQEVAERDVKKGSEVIYILHGNTKETAEVKTKLRQWLRKHPLVNRMNPAELSEGGDAYTVVELDFQ
jgi:dsDNA-specific endonuclease/ATPase MutS2